MAAFRHLHVIIEARCLRPIFIQYLVRIGHAEIFKVDVGVREELVRGLHKVLDKVIILPSTYPSMAIA